MFSGWLNSARRAARGLLLPPAASSSRKLIQGLGAGGTFLAGLFVILACSGCERTSQATVSTSAVIGTQGVEPGAFVQPRAIAASPGGKLFVVDMTGRVQRFDASGRFELSWEMPDNDAQSGKPSGLCVDHLGRVFVADTHHHRVVVFDERGRELFRFGQRGMGPGQFMLPTDVAVDCDGFVYVSEYGGNDRISRFNPQADYLDSFGDIQSGLAMLQRPDTSNHRICCFSRDGEFISSFGELGTDPGQLRYPRDLAMLPDGNLAVVDYGNNRLSYFAPQGDFLGSWGRPGRGEDELNAPLNVAQLGGLVLVADSKNHRILSSAWPPRQCPMSARAFSAWTDSGLGE